MEGATTSGVVAGVITEEMLTGVLNELIACLPTVIPVAITFMGIRKAIGFVFSTLRRA